MPAGAQRRLKFHRRTGEGRDMTNPPNRIGPPIRAEAPNVEEQFTMVALALREKVNAIARRLELGAVRGEAAVAEMTELLKDIPSELDRIARGVANGTIKIER